MKKIMITMLVIAVFLLAIPSGYVSAEVKTRNKDVILLTDGGYLIIEVSSESSITRATTSTSKTCSRYDENDEIQWKATLNGVFTYDGITASCTSSSCTITIYKSSWYTISKTAWKEANSAKATCEMGWKLLGVTVNRETIDLSLTCDRYGKVS